MDSPFVGQVTFPFEGEMTEEQAQAILDAMKEAAGMKATELGVPPSAQAEGVIEGG